MPSPQLDSSRGRIVTLLRRGGLTSEDIAATLGVTTSAVRAHITSMERDGIVAKVGKRPGTTRPSHLYGLTAETEQLLSKAYAPLLTRLFDVVAQELPARQVEGLLRRTGQGLAQELSQVKPVSGGVAARMATVSELLNEHLGALTHVEANGSLVIRGAGCPLAALTGRHPGVCLTMESLITEMVGVPVRECCDRDPRPRCCFEVDGRSAGPST